MVYITPTQKQIMELALEKGYLTLGDFLNAYNSKEARNNAITRFQNFGIMVPDIGSKFKIDGKRVQKILYGS